MMDQRTTCGRPLASIEKRLLDDLTRMTGCTAPNASLARQPGVVHHLAISAWVIRPLNVMVTSACDNRYGPDRHLGAQDRWLPERLRLRPHSEPRCSRGTRRDTSRRCGGLATVPSASVLLQVDARERPEHLTTAGDSEGVLLRLAVIGHDGPVDDLLARLLDTIYKRLLEGLTRTTGCTALGFPRKATGGRALATTIYASQSRLSDGPAVMNQGGIQ